MDQYAQKYRDIWEKDPLFKKWLCPTKDKTKAMCSYCRTEISARYTDLIRHSNTKKHKRTFPLSCEVTTIQPKISVTSGEASPVQMAQGRLSLFIAVHSSYMTINHLAEVCKTNFVDSKAAQFNLHRTKCINIINNVLAPSNRSKRCAL